jgi:hypothetical protein
MEWKGGKGSYGVEGKVNKKCRETVRQRKREEENKSWKELNERKTNNKQRKIMVTGQPSFSGYYQHISIYYETLFGHKRFWRQALLSFVRDCTVCALALIRRIYTQMAINISNCNKHDRTFSSEQPYKIIICIACIYIYG